jgi:hypothetical protein
MSYHDSALQDPALLEATVDVLEDAFPQSPTDAVRPCRRGQLYDIVINSCLDFAPNNPFRSW